MLPRQDFQTFGKESPHLWKPSAGWSLIDVQPQKAPGNLLELVTKMTGNSRPSNGDCYVPGCVLSATSVPI